MIDSLTGKFFETHLDTYIEFCEGVNVLIGESDEGKSGIVRMIKWNSRNRPQGESYRNDQLDPKKKEDKLKIVEVGTNYKDSGLVVRARDGFPGGVNHYQIDDGEPLRALRTDVPDEVQDVTRMKDVNIQGQHPSEQYFLLADKPGQVAKEFNKVAGLTIMDKASSDINSQVRNCNAEITVAKKEIETREKELKNSEWLLDAEKFANKLKKFEITLNKKHSEWNEINLLVLSLSKIDIELSEYKGLDDAKKELKSLEKQKQEIEDKKYNQSSIESTVSALIDVDSSLKSVRDTEKALNVLKELKTLKSNIDSNLKKIENIEDFLAKLDYNEKAIKIAEMEYKNAKKEYDTIREKIECPTCGRKG